MLLNLVVDGSDYSKARAYAPCRSLQTGKQLCFQFKRLEFESSNLGITSEPPGGSIKIFTRIKTLKLTILLDSSPSGTSPGGTAGMRRVKSNFLLMLENRAFIRFLILAGSLT
jgi:hypothetical protein